ncbi:hypothetical protein [Pelosinus sp. IPA-1]|uniref:hypothetical protein n=1 Tax=Pelosinus sp. IPA-1 TaxID=3029569 RepID=UPI0024361E18|nr:hypothetical protein [Pelosinus sp. IPA-1]GMA97230.1 hypothetical protein PIPA1_00300 [Pelosinus sp. IPA-1]
MLIEVGSKVSLYINTCHNGTITNIDGSKVFVRFDDKPDQEESYSMNEFLKMLKVTEE